MSISEQSLHRIDGHYTKLYATGEKHDSPELSRVSMIRRIYAVIHQGLPTATMLNIGSGPQSLEKQLRTQRGARDIALLNTVRSFSIDIATIPPNRLLGKNSTTLLHTQADALHLPFASESLGLVVSNHAIDFIPRATYDQPYRESKRLLVPKGTAIFYFHHPSMLPEDLGIVKNENVRNHWNYLRENNILFESKEAIHECLVSRVGFGSVDVSTNSDGRDTWWEVVAQNR